MGLRANAYLALMTGTTRSQFKGNAHTTVLATSPVVFNPMRKMQSIGIRVIATVQRNMTASSHAISTMAGTISLVLVNASHASNIA